MARILPQRYYLARDRDTANQLRNPELRTKVGPNANPWGISSSSLPTITIIIITTIIVSTTLASKESRRRFYGFCTSHAATPGFGAVSSPCLLAIFHQTVFSLLPE